MNIKAITNRQLVEFMLHQTGEKDTNIRVFKAARHAREMRK